MLRRGVSFEECIWPGHGVAAMHNLQFSIKGSEHGAVAAAHCFAGRFCKVRSVCAQCKHQVFLIPLAGNTPTGRTYWVLAVLDALEQALRVCSQRADQRAGPSRFGGSPAKFMCARGVGVDNLWQQGADSRTAGISTHHVVICVEGVRCSHLSAHLMQCITMYVSMMLLITSSVAVIVYHVTMALP